MSVWQEVHHVARTGDIVKTAVKIREKGLNLDNYYDDNAILYGLSNKAMEVLLKLGVDPTGPPTVKGVGFCAAVGGASYTKIELMIRHGANVNVQDRNGMTPLIHASKLGTHSVAVLLLNNGANIGIADHDGNTALHHSVMARIEHVTDLLVQSGADVFMRNSNGHTPLEALENRFPTRKWPKIESILMQLTESKGVH